jgi:hypothetical protein
VVADQGVGHEAEGDGRQLHGGDENGNLSENAQPGGVEIQQHQQACLKVNNCLFAHNS